MKNWEALKALSEGKCVRHESWRKYGRDLDTPLSIQLLSLNDGWEEIPEEQGKCVLIAEFKKLLRVYGNAHFACGEHPDDAPIDEYDVLVEKVRDAERAIVEWVENRV